MIVETLADSELLEDVVVAVDSENDDHDIEVVWPTFYPFKFTSFGPF